MNRTSEPFLGDDPESLSYFIERMLELHDAGRVGQGQAMLLTTRLASRPAGLRLLDSAHRYIGEQLCQTSDPLLFRANLWIQRSTAGFGAASTERNAAARLSFGPQGLKLLKEVEDLKLKPYDDQTGKETASWVAGATVGYGHLIKKAEWDLYKKGITTAQADSLLEADLAPFVSAVQANVTAQLTQNEFDALVIFAYNVGADGFAGSSVVKLINDPTANTEYKSLEQAWKAWNKSQGKVMKGLDNRRQCEWTIFSTGAYKKW